MSIWKRDMDPMAINQWGQRNMVKHLDIEIVDVGEDFISGTMPVDHRTQQPMGILHGGASCVLAETLGSTASYLCCDGDSYPVGLSLQIHHLKSVTSGHVLGTARPLHLGKSTHVWEIRLTEGRDHTRPGQLMAVAQLTTFIKKRQ